MMEEPLDTNIRLLKTAALGLNLFVVGTTLTMTSPVVISLAHALDTDYDSIGWGVTIMGIGQMVGSLGSGPLFDSYRSLGDAQLFGSSLLAAVSIAAIPWFQTVGLYYVAMAVVGLANGYARTGVYSLCTCMWALKVSLPMHLIMAAQSAGLGIAPVVAIRFVRSEDNSDANTTELVRTNSSSMSGPNPLSTEVESGIAPLNIYYGIFGMIALVSSVPHLLFFVTGQRYPPREQGSGRKQSPFAPLHPRTYSPGRMIYGVVFLCVLFVAIVAIFACTSALDVMGYTIAVEEVGSPEALSALLFSLRYVVEILGKLIIGALSHFCRIQVLTMSLIFGMVVTECTLCFVGLRSSVAWWVLLLVKQFFVGTLLITNVTWAHEYIELTGVVSSVTLVAAGVGFGLGAGLGGELYQNWGAQHVLYMTAAWSVAVAACIVPLQIVSYFKGPRIQTQVLNTDDEKARESFL